MFKVLVLLGLLSGVGHAQTTTPIDVTQTRQLILTAVAPVFGTPQVPVIQPGTGPSTLAAKSPVGATALGITYEVAAVGTATVQTEVLCEGSTTWIVVAGSSVSIDSAAIAVAGVDIANPLPQCAFRTNVTAEAGAGAGVTTRAYFTVRQ